MKEFEKKDIFYYDIPLEKMNVKFKIDEKKWKKMMKDSLEKDRLGGIKKENIHIIFVIVVVAMTAMKILIQFTGKFIDFFLRRKKVDRYFC